MEVVILLMIYPIKCVSKQNRGCKLNVFTMIARINESKTLTKHI